MPLVASSNVFLMNRSFNVPHRDAIPGIGEHVLVSSCNALVKPLFGNADLPAASMCYSHNAIMHGFVACAYRCKVDAKTCINHSSRCLEHFAIYNNNYVDERYLARNAVDAVEV